MTDNIKLITRTIAALAVRYAWSNLPIGGLENSRQLPAYLFRTDIWPLTPHQSTGEYQVEKTDLK